jgi:hypothetical protein
MSAERAWLLAAALFIIAGLSSVAGLVDRAAPPEPCECVCQCGP